MRSTPIQPSDSTSSPQSASAEALAPLNHHRCSSIDRSIDDRAGRTAVGRRNKSTLWIFLIRGQGSRRIRARVLGPFERARAIQARPRKSDVIPRRVSISGCDTPRRVAARGGLAIATKKMFARRKQGIKGGRRRFMRKLPPPRRARRPRRLGRRNEGGKIASARYDSERNFIPTRRTEFLTCNALNIIVA